MPDHSKEFGLIGLGNIGASLAEQALAKGWRVVGYDKRPSAPALVQAGLETAAGVVELCRALTAPRVILLYVPAGAVVDSLLDEIGPMLETDDVVVDGGNSYWGDTIRRAERLKARGLHFVDVGTSGGVPGAKEGACFMTGGDKRAIARIEPILRSLAVAGGFVHAGPSGAGHFVKLVHNGIEFGMMQAIAEGVDLLGHYRDAIPISDVLRCWRHGSVIRSWLIDLLEEEYRAQGGLDAIPPYVEDTGEVNWLVDDAMRMEVPIPVIAQSIMQLLASRDGTKNWARSIAMMRHRFGNHPYGPDAETGQHRTTSRVGSFIG